MATSIMNPRVDFFFKSVKWHDEYEQLRMIALDIGLKEELKWGCPCYSDDKKNIVLIHGFKDYCAVLFFKGALLKDPKGILIQQTKNVQSARQVRFTNVKEIVKLAPTLKKYIKEAIEVEKAGLKVPLKKTTDYAVPQEFRMKLDKMPALKRAFAALTPGRQRAYIFYFSQPKQAKTREARVEKYLQQILSGKGLDD
ncbi:MAG: YdeI/OmpD-associated family protein [Niastella sp.]|uniref:YdeI/OmpD-associated family protein n=1 Tax=Niastella sp. TaxID=1869183 RepID=UPI00389B240C